MAEYTPLLVSVGFLLFVGLALPFMVGFVMDVDDITPSSLVSPLVDVVEDGFEIDVIPFTDWGTFNINPFSWLGSDLQDYFSDSLTFLGAFPNFLIVIILILSILSIVITILKLVTLS